MPSILPIALTDLLHQRGVELARVEFKATWDADVVGPQVLATICAFANDLHNLNGGYVVLGVAERDGHAVLPPDGRSAAELAAAQTWLRGHCHTIDPVYQPVLSPEVFGERLLLVVWAPASQVRPHQAPLGARAAGRGYFVRFGSSTVAAESRPALLTQLMQLTARAPFDDRRALLATITDLREHSVRAFVAEIGSGLAEEPDNATLYRALRIVDPVNGHDAPRNIGLLCFSQDPERWFPGAHIEVVRFEQGGDVLDERVFAGRPIQDQLRDCLAYLSPLFGLVTTKQADDPQAQRYEQLPGAALREALANAVYHRS